MSAKGSAKKLGSFLLFLLRRTLIMLMIAFKFCLFLPIPLFMILFSYKVDISGLFQGELSSREVATMLLEGKTVSNYEQMDERQVLELYVQNLPPEKIPQTLALGSSRVMQLNQEMVGGRFFNGGLSGAGLMDVMNTWYLFERADKLPENLVLCVDPWLFNGASASDLNKKADPQLFAEFLEKGLGLSTSYEEPDPVELWQALADPAYFQGNVRYFLQQQKTGDTVTEDGQKIPFKALADGAADYDYAIKYSDGSIRYPADFRAWDSSQVLAEALNQAGTLPAMHGFDEMDPYWTDLFDQFITHVQQKGVKVVFLLTPYHPFICLHVHNNPQEFGGFFQVEPWLRDYAQQHHIPLYGSYHPGRVGIPESLFFDGVHCRGQALHLMFPGIEQAIQEKPTVYEELYLEKYGDQFNSRNALIGTDKDCVSPNEEWFEMASHLTREERTAQQAAHPDESGEAQGAGKKAA